MVGIQTAFLCRDLGSAPSGAPQRAACARARHAPPEGGGEAPPGVDRAERPGKKGSGESKTTTM